MTATGHKQTKRHHEAIPPKADIRSARAVVSWPEVGHPKNLLRIGWPGGAKIFGG